MAGLVPSGVLLVEPVVAVVGFAAAVAELVESAVVVGLVVTELGHRR